MKITLLMLALTIGSVACKKAQDVTPTQLVEMPDTSAVLKYSGTFKSGPYGKVTGEARIYKQGGNYFLQLENFKSSGGPNLHVFLSKEETPSHYKDLGSLKSLGGFQTYEIDESLDNNPYLYICIHCVDYNHLFGSAKL